VRPYIQTPVLPKKTKRKQHLPKARSMQRNTDKLDIVKIKRLCFPKDLAIKIRTKGYSQDWEKIFVKHIPDLRKVSGTTPPWVLLDIVRYY
jgi:hypothetical protein